MAKARVYHTLPCHHVPLFDTWVKSLTNAGGLKKGSEYCVRLITDTGKLQLVGNIDRLFPMSSFALENQGGATVDKSNTTEAPDGAKG